MTVAKISGQSRERSGLLDGQKGFAALYVALHHVSCTIWRPYDSYGGETRLPAGFDYYFALPFFYGGMSVALFIAISGFSLGAAGLRSPKINILKFYLRRLWRITPPYYVGLLLSMVLIWTLIGAPTGSHWDLFVDYRLSDVFYHLIYIQNLVSAFAAQAINGAYWSVALEMQFYAAFPLIILIFRFNLVLGVIASGALVGLSYATKTLFLLDFNTHLLIFFLLGVCGSAICYSNDRSAEIIRRVVPFGWVGLVGLVAGIAYLAIRPESIYPAERVIIVSMICWMIEDNSRQKPFIFLKLFDNRILSSVGLYAYSLYLIHEPLEQIIWRYGIQYVTDDKLFQFLILVPATVAVLIPASLIFFRLFEEPFLNKSRFEKFYTRLNPSQLAVSR